MPQLRLNPRLTDPSYYDPDPALVDAVNVAIHLGKPLFLTGNPGTGKTQLAHHIAHFFRPDQEMEEPLLVFNTRSTSTARDLFYHYDSLGHFHFIQSQKSPLYLLNSEQATLEQTEVPAEIPLEEIEEKFIRYNALGVAIKENRRRVVLIDELDKAPRDLPNDILNVLEDMSFEVPEIGRIHERKFQSNPHQRPIVIITSNSERTMPEPFLRRCVYFHLEDPDDERLQQILMAKLDLPEQVVQKIVNHYNDLQSRLTKRRAGVAELIYWAYLLHKRELDLEFFPASLVEAQDQWPKREVEKLISSYVVLVKNEQDFKKLRDELKVTKA